MVRGCGLWLGFMIVYALWLLFVIYFYDLWFMVRVYGCLCSVIIVYGLLFMVYGLWFIVYGLLFMVYGLWFMVYGLWLGFMVVYAL